ncbi:MAG: Crp/Fnr family transcriptional regulator [Dysosmobacter sp.]
MELRETFPFWDQLSASQQALITQRAVLREVPAGAVLSGAGTDCVGLLVLRSGRLRAYVLSQDGREVTLYRLTAGEICLFSASCVLGTAQMDLTVEAEQDSTVWVIPPDVFRQISHESAAAAGYVNTLMARRFSEVMWLVEQVMWQSMDRRLAAFLLEESELEHTDTLRLTHEQIANHLGTAREVVTRMLRYFQSEGMVRLSRGTVAITDRRRLEALRPASV